jgi:hypothetical protein
MKLINLMKRYLLTFQTTLILSALAAHGQGTMIYDQQSATNRDVGVGGVPIQQEQPMGQSFTPALASVGFVQFEFLDNYPGGVGITVYVNLLAGSITGTVLDSTAPVFMPDGFLVGITNFFFATPVAVTPGTTYYFQPVLQSGDSNYSGMEVGSYGYPGGTLFINGSPDPNGYDLWFREGYIVPEPASGSLVLLGIAGIWAAWRLRTKGLVLILVAAGAAGICSAGAQTTQTNSGRAYFSMQHPEWPPLPVPKPGCAVLALPGQPGWWKFDDLDLDYAAAQLALPPLPGPGSIGGGNPDDGTNGGSAGYGTNLWLELTGIVTNAVDITAHNVDDSQWFQLLSKTDLLAELDWTVEQQIEQPAETNLSLTVLEDGRPAVFFWGAQSDTLVKVTWGSDTIRPSCGYTNQPGYFVIQRRTFSESYESELWVYYRISGTASNGVDYTYLASTTNIPAGLGYVQVWVNPLPSLSGSNLTVTLTLVMTNGYLVDSNSPSATVVIEANVFSLVASNMYTAVGLAYHPPTESLLVSVDPVASGGTNFVRIDTNGVYLWADVGLSRSVTIATVKTTSNGFVEGDMYFDNTEGPGIGWLTNNGTAWDTDWLNVEGWYACAIGGLYVDQTGVFGGDLIATAGSDYSPFFGGCVWRINSATNLTKWADFSYTSLGPVITLTNDVAQWGPWAGKIITGQDPNDLLLLEPDGDPAIYAIDINQQVTTNYLGIQAEHLDLIPPNQSFYCCDCLANAVWKVPAGVFTNHVGQLLITGAGQVPYWQQPPALFIVHWDAGATKFVVEEISAPDFVECLEDGAFAPIELPCLPHQ